MSLKMPRVKNKSESAKESSVKQTQAISLRLAVADIERAKQSAATKGIGYQTLLRMLLHEALHR
jgi:predicted DNA binding CopG/RHH family protein